MEQSKVEKRHNEILKMLNSNDSVTVAEFCENLKCSESTIRNDLAFLEKNGQLLRTFGGAVKTGITPYNLLDVKLRKSIYLQEKTEIARCVVEKLIAPHKTVILDAGTTCQEIAVEMARQRIPGTVITNSFYAAAALVQAADTIDLYMFGGLFDSSRGRFYDVYLPNAFDHMRADLYLMGVDGINADSGVSITGVDEIQTKRQFMGISQKTVAVADHSKMGRNSLRLLASFDELDAVVVDKKTPAADVSRLLEKGVKVLGAE